MKRYVYASSKNDVFDLTKTGFSFYNQFLNPEELEYMEREKNLTGYIDMMSPEDYYSECSELAHVPVELLKRQRESSRVDDDSLDRRKIDKYIEDMKAGDKFPLCFLDYSTNGQEGLHRMYAAGEVFGWDTEFPVLIVEPYDLDMWNRHKKREAAERYRRDKFKDVVSKAADGIADPDSPPPVDFEEMLKDAIVEMAGRSEFGSHDIDVRLRTDDGSTFVYLTEYDGLDCTQGSFDVQVWLEDLYEWYPIEPNDLDDPLEPDNLDDIDNIIEEDMDDKSFLADFLFGEDS